MSKAYITSSFLFFISFSKLRLYSDSSKPFHSYSPFRMIALINWFFLPLNTLLESFPGSGFKRYLVVSCNWNKDYATSKYPSRFAKMSTSTISTSSKGSWSREMNHLLNASMYVVWSVVELKLCTFSGFPMQLRMYITSLYFGDFLASSPGERCVSCLNDS